jgi:hypothetical protein
LALRFSILGLVELLLGKGGEEQPQTFHLNGRQDSMHDIVVILNGEKFALGYISQIGSRCKKDGRRKFGDEMVRDVEVHVKALKRTPFHPFYLLDLVLRKDLAAGFVLDVRKGQKTLREKIFFPDLIRRHRRPVHPRSLRRGV